LLIYISSNNLSNAHGHDNNIFVDRLGISNSANNLLLDSVLLGDRVETIKSTDKIILYYANVGIINPKNKKYSVRIICINNTGDVIIKGAYKTIFSDQDAISLKGESIRTTLITVGLDPKPNAMVQGQLLRLQNNTDYYIKLFIEKKLIGVTKFTYIVAAS
jgi:hypothetical protein